MQRFTSPYPIGGETALVRAAFLSGGRGAVPGARPDLVDAWERSQAAGVSPNLDRVPRGEAGAALSDQRTGRELLSAGQAILNRASEQLHGTGFGLILAGADGTVLHVAGDPALRVAAERVGSLPGATWREDLAGNNAIGTALQTRRPAHFAYYEHWCAGWTDWVCAAVPVRSGAGPLLGAVCICAHRRPPAPAMLPEAASLVRRLVRVLSAASAERTVWLQAEAAKLHRWFPGKGVLAVDCTGAVVWTAGPVPRELTASLQQGRPAFLPAKLRGEQEVLVAGRWPCLVVPLWQDREWLGHAVITGEAEPAAAPVRRVAAGDRDRLLLLSPDQILAARLDGGRVNVLLDTGELPTPYESLRDLQAHLPEAAFFQVDRGCLVNLTKVREVRPMFNRTLHLVLSDRKATVIPVARRRAAELRDLLQL